MTNYHKCDTLDTDAGSTADSFEVTNLTESLRDENRLNIYIDGEFGFSLDISQVVDFGVKVGKRFTGEEIEKLRTASEFGKLYTRALAWVLSRPHSVKETRDYLSRCKTKRTADNKRRAYDAQYKEEHQSENPYRDPQKLDESGRLKFKNSPWARSTKILPEIAEENIDAVMARLIEKGYLDDEKFARYFVENRRVAKGISTTRLRQELKLKGIDSSLIDEVLSSSTRDQKDEIRKIVKKKSKKYPPSKLRFYLQRQGFPLSDINSVLAEAETEIEPAPDF